MWKIFNIFSKYTEAKNRRREEKIRKVQRIREEVVMLEKRVKDTCQKSNDARYETCKKLNSRCPKCLSNHVNDRVQRIQGAFSGSISGSSSLFGGSIYGSSSGKIDTNEVNKCNDCGHEWKKHDYKFSYETDEFQTQLKNVVWWFTKYVELVDCEYDPLDINEKFNSLEEKKIHIQKEFDEYFTAARAKDFWKGISIDTFYMLFDKHMECHYKNDLDKKYTKEFLLNKVGMTK